MYSVPAPEKTDYLLILRGLAAFGVLLGHAFGIGRYSLGVFISDSPTASFAMIDHPLSAFKYALFVLVPLLGNNFVILFFVQSGYLMGKIFHDQRYKLSRDSIYAFYRNWFFRLAPLLYFNLLIAACFFVNAQFSPQMFVGDVLFITNFTGRGLNLVTWSLSHEMQYYLLAPFVFALFRSPRYATLLWLAICAYITYHFTRSGFLSHFQYLYAFVAGYSINILLRLRPFEVTERTKIATVILCSLLVDVVYNWLFIAGWSRSAEIAVTLFTASAVFIAECDGTHEVSTAHPVLGKILRFTMLTGTLSYGIYLWHYMVIVSRADLFSTVVDHIAAHTNLIHMWEKIVLYHSIQLSCTLLVTYALALATFHGIETRFRPGLYRSAPKDAVLRAQEQPAQ